MERAVVRPGVEKPLHIGLGVSFSFNPYVDSFLVIPAAMQTIVINSRCICSERQGILVQAYVQWIIDDIATAYRKLDFSDAEDPMRVVNVQLREQAEAAIKDTVATMPIDEVLADKQPIIEELTTRLRAVAEGSRDAASGLGLKIVTVQIKEAVVSSTRLWENLQTPFRSERERLARMAALDAERQIKSRELEIRQAHLTAEISAERQIQKEKNGAEVARREGELEVALKTFDIERTRVNDEVRTIAERKKLDAANAERRRFEVEQALGLEELKSKARAAIAEREVADLRARREVENLLSEEARLIALLPEIAGKLPAPQELRTVNIGGDGATASLTGLLSSLRSVLDSYRKDAPRK